MDINIDFIKYIEYKGQNIFKLIKTKTNRYYLTECQTNKIVATTKRQILRVIKDYGIKNILEERID